MPVTSRDNTVIKTAVVTSLVTSVIIFFLGYLVDMPKIKMKITDMANADVNIASQLEEVKQQNAAMLNYFEGRYNGINFLGLAKLASQKGLPDNTLYKTLSVMEIENDANKSGNYLINELKFTPDEVKLVLPNYKPEAIKTMPAAVPAPTEPATPVAPETSPATPAADAQPK